MAVPFDDVQSNSAPFEGPEKLLEVWFAPSSQHVPDAHNPKDGRIGLRKVPRHVWEDMLDIVKCKVLSVIEGHETDAYLLSESSLFVFAHRLILKTCGTTLNLLGLPRILEIAREYTSLPTVYRCFYSRKSFMFPERQHGPHREWKDEVAYLDAIFPNGSAYTVGKVNGDHWLLYITTPGGEDTPLDRSVSSIDSLVSSVGAIDVEPIGEDARIKQDYTIEILMTHLSPGAREPFFSSAPSTPSEDASVDPASNSGRILSESIGISDLFPSHLTTLDAYAFSPCGYSCNALLRWGETDNNDGSEETEKRGEGYYTIHVTPEEGWSYASFECNVPLSTSRSSTTKEIPDLRTLIRRVVDIFCPGRLSLTLFISSSNNEDAEELDGESAIEAAQKAFKSAMMGRRPLSGSSSGSDVEGSEWLRRGRRYRRTDKINYEFGGYDLAFATFELC